MLTVLQTSVILPLPESLQRKTRATLFFDIGNVFSNGNVNFRAPDGSPISYAFGDSDLKYSTGLAVSWLSPLGLFKFSYAFPLNAEDRSATSWGDNTERFQFTIGGAF